MKKFKFSLEDVLKYRSFLQRQAELELGKARAKEAEIERKIEELAKRKVRATDNSRGVLDFSEINATSNYYELLAFQKEYLLAELAKAKLVSEKKREVLKEAMQKTRALEKLKERELKLYKESENKEDSDELDEVNTIRQRAVKGEYTD